MLESLTSQAGVLFLLRWLHLFLGVVWIGLLYYFNFVLGAFVAETDAATKSNVTQKLMPRALWWFRYAALWTFLTGWAYLALKGPEMAGQSLASSAYWIYILTGAGFGTLMFLNVWLLIWPNQKVVIANAVTVAGGGAANPAAAGAAAAALLASRTNTVFSIPMLFFMGAASHFPHGPSESSNVTLYAILVGLTMLALEINAIKGKTGPMTSIKGVITCGFVLTALVGVFIAITI